MIETTQGKIKVRAAYMLKFKVLSLVAALGVAIPSAKAVESRDSLLQEFLAKVGSGFSDPRMKEITQAAARDDIDAILAEDSSQVEYWRPAKTCILLCESLVPETKKANGALSDTFNLLKLIAQDSNLVL